MTPILTQITKKYPGIKSKEGTPMMHIITIGFIVIREKTVSLLNIWYAGMGYEQFMNQWN